MWLIAPDQALVFTLDCFMPIHDDAHTFGQIVAANSLSDVWAMGGRPLVALNVCGYPRKTLPMEILTQILKGGAAKASEAGVPIAGGHTMDNPEPFYGLAVLGTIHPERIVRNVGAQPGDQLVLTKPLGTGIVMTAAMNDEADDDMVSAATASMTALNRAASEVMVEAGAHAATDVTGFGLIGHGHEMAVASGVGLKLWRHRLPALPGALELAQQGTNTGGGMANLDYYEAWTDFGALSEAEQAIVCDPQTSGGLLMALPPERLDWALDALRERGVVGHHIGEVTEGSRGRLAFG